MTPDNAAANLGRMLRRPQPSLGDWHQQRAHEDVHVRAPARPIDIARLWMRHGADLTKALLECGHTFTAADDSAAVPVGAPASIFISYAHADQQLARALYEGLKAHGHRAWIDEHELRVGDSLIGRIATAIADIDFFLPLVSPAAAHSRWWRKELELAISAQLARTNMRLMPLRVGGAQMPTALSDQLYLDVSHADVNAAIDRLVRDIASYQEHTAW